MAAIEFIDEKIGFDGEIITTHRDPSGKKICSYTEIPPSGLSAMIADGSGSSKVIEVVPLYEGEFMVGYVDPTGKPVILIDGPYKL